MKLFSTARALRLPVLATGLLLYACSGPQEKSPQLAAATSTQAQTELRRLSEEWELRSPMGRRELRGDLERYIRDFPWDPSVKRARLMLAQIALMERRLDGARELVAPLVKGPQGIERDEAIVILAAVESESGNHERALELLAPLQGKLLSPESRDQYSRVRTSAAIAARRWRLVLDSMTRWLVEAGAEAPPVKTWIREALVDVPSTALSRLLADWPEQSHDKAEAQARDFLHRTFIEQLTLRALETQDALLAKELLLRAPPWLRASENGDKLAVLAALAQQDAQVVGRSVGIVLGGQTAVQRRRAIRVGTGLVRGLGLGQTESARAEIKLLTAESRGAIAQALGTLSGLGASILVAGVDAAGADEALAFAAQRQVPVVVLSEPSRAKAGDYGFVFGVGEETEQSLMKATFPTESRWVFVGAGGDCSGPSVDKLSFPVGTWREDGVTSVGVLGGTECAHALGADLRASGLSVQVVLGLLSAHQPPSQLKAPWIVSVGQFPQASRVETSDRMSDAEKAMKDGALPPLLTATDWYSVLGYDVALLLKQALSQLPQSAATEKDQVRARHDNARNALRSARAKLLTSESTGFNSNQVIERNFRVIPKSAGGEVKP